MSLLEPYSQNKHKHTHNLFRHYGHSKLCFVNFISLNVILLRVQYKAEVLLHRGIRAVFIRAGDEQQL